MSKTLYFLAYCILLFIVAGCSHLNGTTVSPEKFATAYARVVCERALKPGDVLEFSVEVGGKPEVVSRRVTVDYKGKITVPMAGDLQVAGHTPVEVRDIMKEAYGRFYVSEPLVILALKNDQDEGAWGSVTVLGQVKNPGSVPLTESSLRLSEVIQRAGGFSPSARQNEIRVSRMSPEDRQVRCVIDFREIGQNGRSDSDLYLFAGDVVYVPERIF